MSRLLYGDIGKVYYDDEGRAWRVKARSVWRNVRLRKQTIFWERAPGLDGRNKKE